MRQTLNIFRRTAADRGQALVEFVFVLPLLLLLMLGICQFGLAFHNYLSITDATRVGARAAAVTRTADPSADPCAAARSKILEAVSSTQQSKIVFPGDDWCTAGPNAGDPVRLTVKYPYSIGLPGFSASGDLTANATERLE